VYKSPKGKYRTQKWTVEVIEFFPKDENKIQGQSTTVNLLGVIFELIKWRVKKPTQPQLAKIALSGIIERRKEFLAQSEALDLEVKSVLGEEN